MNDAVHELWAHTEMWTGLRQTYEGTPKTLTYSADNTCAQFPKDKPAAPHLSSKTCSSILHQIYNVLCVLQRTPCKYNMGDLYESSCYSGKKAHLTKINSF